MVAPSVRCLQLSLRAACVACVAVVFVYGRRRVNSRSQESTTLNVREMLYRLSDRLRLLLIFCAIQITTDLSVALYLLCRRPDLHMDEAFDAFRQCYLSPLCEDHVSPSWNKKSFTVTLNTGWRAFFKEHSTSSRLGGFSSKGTCHPEFVCYVCNKLCCCCGQSKKIRSISLVS